MSQPLSSSTPVLTHSWTQPLHQLVVNDLCCNHRCELRDRSWCKSDRWHEGRYHQSHPPGFWWLSNTTSLCCLGILFISTVTREFSLITHSPALQERVTTWILSNVGALLPIVILTVLENHVTSGFFDLLPLLIVITTINVIMSLQLIFCCQMSLQKEK